MRERKQVLLLGGLGVIGRILWRGLTKEYKLIIGDLSETPVYESMEYRRIDITDYEELCDSIPKGTCAIVNLAGIPRQDRVVDVHMFRKMMAVYAQGAYNVLQAACATGVAKVVLVSTNHVTGMSEKEGLSLIGKEIDLSIYPKPDDIYGGFKLAQESWGRVISDVSGLSVICLRIGTVVEDECEELKKSTRVRRTLLSQVDSIALFRCAIEAKVKFGIYCGVSDNPERPWSIRNAIEELNYKPSRNSMQVLKDCLSRTTESSNQRRE